MSSMPSEQPSEATSVPSTNPVSPQSVAASVGPAKSSPKGGASNNIAAIKKLIAVTKLPSFGLARTETLDATRDALASAGIKINGQIWQLITDETSWEFIFGELLAAVSAAKKDMPVEKFRPKLRRQFEVSRKHVTHCLQVQIMIRALKSIIDSTMKRKGASSPPSMAGGDSSAFLGASGSYKSFSGGVESGEDYLLEGETINTILEPFLLDVEGSADTIALSAAKQKMAEEKLELDKPPTPAIGEDGNPIPSSQNQKKTDISSKLNSEPTQEQQKLQKLFNKFLQAKFDILPNQMDITKLDPLVRLASSCFVCEKMNIVFDRDELHRALVFNDGTAKNSYPLSLSGMPAFPSATVADALTVLSGNPTFKKITDCVAATKNFEVSARVTYKGTKPAEKKKTSTHSESYLEALAEPTEMAAISPSTGLPEQKVFPLFILKGTGPHLQRMLSMGDVSANSDKDSQGALAAEPSSSNLNRGKSVKATAPVVAEKRIVFSELLPDFQEAMKNAVEGIKRTQPLNTLGTAVALAESVVISDDEEATPLASPKRTLPLTLTVNTSTIHFNAKVPSLHQIIVSQDRPSTAISTVHLIVMGLEFLVLDWDFSPPAPTGPSEADIRRATAVAEVERLQVIYHHESDRKDMVTIECGLRQEAQLEFLRLRDAILRREQALLAEEEARRALASAEETRSQTEVASEEAGRVLTSAQQKRRDSAEMAHSQSEVALEQARTVLNSAQQRRRQDAEVEHSQNEVAGEETLRVLNSARQRRQQEVEMEMSQTEVAEQAARKALSAAQDKIKVEVEELHRRLEALQVQEALIRRSIEEDDIKTRKAYTVKAAAERKRIKEAKLPLIDFGVDTQGLDHHLTAADGSYFQRIQLTANGRVTFKNVQVPNQPTFKVLKAAIEAAIGMRLSFGFATHAFENAPIKSNRSPSKPGEGSDKMPANVSPSKLSAKVAALLAATHPTRSPLKSDGGPNVAPTNTTSIGSASTSALPIADAGPSSPSNKTDESTKPLGNSTNFSPRGYYGTGGELKCRELSQGAMKVFLSSEVSRRLVVCRPLFPSLMLLEQEYSSTLPVFGGALSTHKSTIASPLGNRSSSVPLSHGSGADGSPKRSITSLENKVPKVAGWMPASLNKPMWKDDKVILPRILEKSTNGPSDSIESPKASPKRTGATTFASPDANGSPTSDEGKEEASPDHRSPHNAFGSRSLISHSSTLSPLASPKLSLAQQQAIGDRLSKDSVAHKKAQIAKLDAQFWPTSKSPVKSLNANEESKVVQRLGATSSQKRAQTLQRVAKELDEARFGTKKPLVVTTDAREELTKHFYQDGVERRKKVLEEATKRLSPSPKKYVQKTPEEWATWQQQMNKGIGKDIRQKDYLGGI